MGRPERRAWAVHLYTALGLVLAALMAVFIVRGSPSDFRIALALMMLATLVDATDGWLARRARVEEVLPRFDGRRLDDIIDFHTYTSMPLLLIWRAGLLPGAWAWIALAPLLVSAFGFSRRDAKTEDGFFLGFPSYWNVVAFYLFFLRTPPWLSAAVLVGFAALTLVPSRYPNLAVPARGNRVMLGLAAIWGVLAAGILAGLVGGRAVVLVSLAFPAYYLARSWMSAR